ncbi:insulin-like growth factor 2 mRNA-binding protein 2 isoform X4 [Littorina saxatilis]|uniref:insulin-like growth factor 2 mRNA-binding protein 2 isoform X4 n=1 Tax=Littorina saxatilis TaxID=31220 RepID=UPI0038B5BA6B
MKRIQFTNLSVTFSEDTLRGLLEEKGYAVSNILLKESSAVVELEDPHATDKAIDSLKGVTLNGQTMQVEAISRRSRKGNKIQIRNIPSNISRESIEAVVQSVASGVQKVEEVGAEGAVYVTFDTPDNAQQAVTSLDGYHLEGANLKVDFANNKSPRRPRSNVNSNSGMNRQELPLRIVVGSEYVGAIIGKSGQTIRNITQQSRARVDIHRRDNIAPETLVTIKGSPEACSKACKEIMKVVQAEAQSLNRGDCPLRILCPNSLCGRIIGKKGNVIKSFMEKSNTNIVVSSFETTPYPGSMNDMSGYYVDRVITITGNLDDAIKAEEMLSEKMRQCFEQDANLYQQNGGFGLQQQQMMFSGLPTLPMMPGGMNNYPGARPPYPYMRSVSDVGGILHPQGGATNYYQQQRSPYGVGPNSVLPQQQLEVVYLYIPEQSVGAVIGSKGQNIKNIMHLSAARIKIMSGEGKNGSNGSEKSGGGGGHQGQHGVEERKVIITGTPEAQWKAQFYIFEKVKSEMRLAQQDEVHLRSEVVVPKATIGRIIGKGGQNVKEMQRVSGAIVQVPEDQGEVEEVPVTIIGHFYACQSAQRRIRALMNNIQGLQQPRRTGRPGSQQPGQVLQMNGN